MARKAYLKDGRILCSLCSSPLNPDATVCSKCNERLEGDFKAIICPDCKIILATGTNKCYNCGLKFKAVSSRTEVSDDEAFLWRLLKWSEDELESGEKEGVTPTVKKTEEAEDFKKEEAKAEKEEGIKSLSEAFKTIIGGMRKKWSSIQSLSLESIESLRNEEKEALEQLEQLVGKVETVFKELLGKHQMEFIEKEGKLKTQLEDSKKETEGFKKVIKKQLEFIKSVKTKLDEKEANIKELQEKNEKLEKENEALVALHKEVRDVLKIVDELLGKLSEDEIERFAKSEEFKHYEAILEKFSV